MGSKEPEKVRPHAERSGRDQVIGIFREVPLSLHYRRSLYFRVVPEGDIRNIGSPNNLPSSKSLRLTWTSFHL
jgi:hypothetical protein